MAIFKYVVVLVFSTALDPMGGTDAAEAMIMTGGLMRDFCFALLKKTFYK